MIFLKTHDNALVNLNYVERITIEKLKEYSSLHRVLVMSRGEIFVLSHLHKDIGCGVFMYDLEREIKKCFESGGDSIICGHDLSKFSKPDEGCNQIGGTHDR